MEFRWFIQAFPLMHPAAGWFTEIKCATTTDIHIIVIYHMIEGDTQRKATMVQNYQLGKY